MSQLDQNKNEQSYCSTNKNLNVTDLQWCAKKEVKSLNYKHQHTTGDQRLNCTESITHIYADQDPLVQQTVVLSGVSPS